MNYDPYVGDDPEYTRIESNTTNLLARVIRNTLDGKYSVTPPGDVTEKRDGSVFEITRAGKTFTVYVQEKK